AFGWGIAAGIFGLWDGIFGAMSVVSRRVLLAGHGVCGGVTCILSFVVLWKCDYLVKIEEARGIDLLMGLALAIICLEIPVTGLEWAIDRFEKSMRVIEELERQKKKIEEEGSAEMKVRLTEDKDTESQGDE